MSPQIRWEKLWNDPDGYKFKSINELTYYSKRYNRKITIKPGFKSDGATGARDVKTDAWGFHDVLCATGKWDDGSLVDNWTASTVLGDILWEDGLRWRAIYWWWATYLFGGGKCRENGMRRIKKRR